MSHLALLLLLLTAFCAGTVNSVAGGGTFITFPALIAAGVPAISANATSTAALFPGTLASAFAYREDMKRIRNVNLPLMLGCSVAGGVLGALLLLLTPDRVFDFLVPILLLAATGLYSFGPWLMKLLRRPPGDPNPRTLAIVQFLISIYGGYFGGAVGIMMLAAYQIFGLTDVNGMAGLKNMFVTLLNIVAVICFAIAGKVVWLPAMVMLVGASAGGYLGARFARRMQPQHVRYIVIAIGLCVSLATFLKG